VVKPDGDTIEITDCGVFTPLRDPQALATGNINRIQTFQALPFRLYGTGYASKQSEMLP
jgi:hypothetical protein